MNNYIFIPLLKKFHKMIAKCWVKILLRVFSLSELPKKNLETWDATFTNYSVIANGVLKKDLLLVNVKGKGLEKIENTPYYSFLNSNGNSGEYANYLRSCFNDINIDDQISKFRKLIASVEKNPNTVYVLVRPRFDYKLRLVIVDGAHRAAIMAHLGFEKIQIKFTF